MFRPPEQPLSPDNDLVRYDAIGAADALNPDLGSELLLEIRAGSVTVLATGNAAQIDQHPAAGAAKTVSCPDCVLIPALVNAHTHLDLTHIGPTVHNADHGFVTWVDLIRSSRQTEPEEIAQSVRQGIDLLLAGGTGAVGDIAGAPNGLPSMVPWQTLAASSLVGVSFLEVFGIGPRAESSRDVVQGLLHEYQDMIDRDAPVRLGLQPHAPNTVAPRLYRWLAQLAQEHDLPLSTHLAETPEERQFIAHATGPQRELLERLGAWDESILSDVGHGKHPVAHLAEILAHNPFLVAHVNDADDAAIQTLAATGTSVAYCPRASDYFEAPRHFGPHRYQDMLKQGVNVCLGTDSIVNLPKRCQERSRGGISILDEMRLLFQRDNTNPHLLLQMATTNGARALGIEEQGFVLAQHGRPLGLVAVDVSDTPDHLPALERVLRSGAPPRLLFLARQAR